MAWTNLTFSFGQVLTSTQMTQLDDNFEALAAGDSGAPGLETAAYDAASVTLAKLANDTKCKGAIASTTSSQSTTDSYVDYETVSLTTTGGKVLVLFAGRGSVISGTLHVAIYRDGTLKSIEQYSGNAVRSSVTALYLDTIGAGTFEYKLKIKHTLSGNATMNTGTLIVLETN